MLAIYIGDKLNRTEQEHLCAEAESAENEKFL
jgi:hypothetical protein